jgi:hypothetical protein
MFPLYVCTMILGILEGDMAVPEASSANGNSRQIFFFRKRRKISTGTLSTGSDFLKLTQSQVRIAESRAIRLERTVFTKGRVETLCLAILHSEVNIIGYANGRIMI